MHLRPGDRCRIAPPGPPRTRHRRASACLWMRRRRRVRRVGVSGATPATARLHGVAFDIPRCRGGGRRVPRLPGAARRALSDRPPGGRRLGRGRGTTGAWARSRWAISSTGKGMWRSASSVTSASSSRSLKDASHLESLGDDSRVAYSGADVSGLGSGSLACIADGFANGARIAYISANDACRAAPVRQRMPRRGTPRLGGTVRRPSLPTSRCRGRANDGGASPSPGFALRSPEGVPAGGALSGADADLENLACEQSHDGGVFVGGAACPLTATRPAPARSRSDGG